MKRMRATRALVIGVIGLVVFGVIAINSFQLWAGVMWLGHLALAGGTRPSSTIERGMSYADAEELLGRSDWEAPGFRAYGHMQAAVAVWDLGDGEEVRALVWRDRIVTAREGEWGTP